MSLVAEDLRKSYRLRDGSKRRALDGVSLAIQRGRTTGIMGESGCGKSTLARLLLRLEDPSGGRIVLEGDDVTRGRGRRLDRLRAEVQLVFQDPYSALNPRRTIGQTIAEVLRHRRDADRTPGDLLSLVGLAPAYAARYPRELSGGQRQRVGIARALAADPTYLILDEPASALDVPVRAEIMNLLARLRDELSLGYLFISHDLSMVRHISDTVHVMYLGRVVEEGPWREVLDRPLHPYSVGLRRAVPPPDPAAARDRRTVAVTGEVPDPASLPTGCTFHPRCPLTQEVCRTVAPTLDPVDGGHRTACHLTTTQRIPT